MGSLAEFPPHVLRDYAFLADGQRGALIGPRGDIGWLCAPRWDSDAVFATLIGGAGCYAVTPTDTFVWGGYYESGGLIWNSRWVTHRSIVESREALSYPGRPDRLVLLRRVTAVEGVARVRVVLDVRAGFGTEPMHVRGRDPHWSGRSGSVCWAWCGAPQARVDDDGRLVAELTVPAGRHHDLVLVIGDGPAAVADPPSAGDCWQSTEAAWRRGDHEVHTVAAHDVRHAHAVLRGMSSAGGGMVAAATTSLPERSDAGRNFDYRYVWIRDQAFTAQSAARAGFHDLLDDATTFLTARLLDDGDRLCPAYRVDGSAVPRQRGLDLPGYPGGYDIVGNPARKQFQLDAFGEALLALTAAGLADRLDDDGRRAVEVAAAAVQKRYQEPDAGIWELQPRYWTHSRLICAAGLRAAATLGGRRADDFARLADRLVDEADRRCRHPNGCWQRAADDPGLDGALLFAGLRGAVPADDPRTVRTLHAFVDQLTEDGFAYRFRHGPGPLGEWEGAFLLCGFGLAMAADQQGDRLAATGWFERSRSACGPAGLLSEEYDIQQRQLRGNLPQGFVHAGLIEAACRLSD